MERLNSEGIPRSDLLWALQQRRVVLRARQQDKCLLCRRPRVNEAGLCPMCYAICEEPELSIVERWMSGIGP